MARVYLGQGRTKIRNGVSTPYPLVRMLSVFPDDCRRHGRVLLCPLFRLFGCQPQRPWAHRYASRVPVCRQVSFFNLSLMVP
jgi:hypothetical protein